MTIVGKRLSAAVFRLAGRPAPRHVCVGSFAPGFGHSRGAPCGRIRESIPCRIAATVGRQVLEIAVLHKLGVKAAVGAIVDVLEKYAYELVGYGLGIGRGGALFAQSAELFSYAFPGGDSGLRLAWRTDSTDQWKAFGYDFVRKELRRDPDGLHTYEYLANHIGECEPSDIELLIDNMERVDLSGHFGLGRVFRRSRCLAGAESHQRRYGSHKE